MNMKYSDPEVKTRANKFTAALRARFKTPQEALRCLGIDENILSGDSGSKQMKRARDQEASTVEEILDMIDQLPEEERLELMNLLQGSVEGEDRRGSRGTGRDRRGARDDPPPFPGRPNTGGSMDPLDQGREDAQDRRRRAMGQDAAQDSRSFYARFPNARRIGFV